jgi:hypothetical protein
MHDLTLEGTTNVADLFPSSRMETFVIEGKAITGYYAINFTLRYFRFLRWQRSAWAIQFFMILFINMNAFFQ